MIRRVEEIVKRVLETPEREREKDEGGGRSRTSEMRGAWADEEWMEKADSDERLRVD